VGESRLEVGRAVVWFWWG